MTVLALAVVVGGNVTAQAPTRPRNVPESLEADMRKLWSDHVIWTRQYIVSAIAQLPDTEAAAERLMKNQDEIGDAIKPFYGNAAGDQLTALLRGHITIATEVVRAARMESEQGVEQANTRWQANADSIASFLGSANPHWRARSVRTELRRHLELTAQQAKLRLERNWEGDVRNFDEIYEQALGMADMLSQGIRRQFVSEVSRAR
jgi:hypothetical protein